MAMYNSYIVERDLLLRSKNLCITKVSLQRDLRSKVQHLMMLCIRGVNQLFPFVILRSKSLL